MHNIVSFPHLNLSFEISRIAFSFIGIDVYYYGIIIGVGLIIATLYAVNTAKKNGISEDIIYDVVLFGIPSSVIFARIYYVAFSFDDYKNNFSDIFKIWEGGIAIYGAVFGAILSTFIYCYVKKVNFKKIVDIGAIGLLIGQSIGRWGNFFNQEAFGSNTNLPFGMISENTRQYLLDITSKGYHVNPTEPVHPTFLYESIWNAFGIFLIIKYKKNQKFDGEIFLLYILWYGIGRFMIEGLRTDSLMMGNIRISQLIAGISAITSLFFITYFRSKKNS